MYTFFPSTTASSSVKLWNGRVRASSKFEPILYISRLRRESKETIVRFRPMPISVPSRDMPQLMLPLRLHALHCLIQALFIRLLFRPPLTARLEDEYVADKLPDTIEKCFDLTHIVVFISFYFCLSFSLNA